MLTVDLSTSKGNVVLIVNVASQCGFTPQYKEMAELYNMYSSQGFVILGFPCNQVGDAILHCSCLGDDWLDSHCTPSSSQVCSCTIERVKQQYNAQLSGFHSCAMLLPPGLLALLYLFCSEKWAATLANTDLLLVLWAVWRAGAGQQCAGKEICAG